MFNSYNNAKSDEEIIRLQEMIGLEELKFERRTIFDEVRLETQAKAKQANLDILNSLNPERQYSVAELAQMFGFTPDELNYGK